MGTRRTTRASRCPKPVYALIRQLIGALTLTWLSLSGLTARAYDDPPREPLTNFPVIDVTVESQGHTHTFKAWLAATPSRHEQGLMYVNSLAANRGMLFVFDQPQPQAFWMKNTLIPLDILFIAPDGRVIRIAENAKPMSLETIQSMGIASEVLELAGGVSHNLGIVAGARIKHSDPSAAPAH